MVIFIIILLSTVLSVIQFTVFNIPIYKIYIDECGKRINGLIYAAFGFNTAVIIASSVALGIIISKLYF